METHSKGRQERAVERTGSTEKQQHRCDQHLSFPLIHVYYSPAKLYRLFRWWFLSTALRDMSFSMALQLKCCLCKRDRHGCVVSTASLSGPRPNHAPLSVSPLPTGQATDGLGWIGHVRALPSKAASSPQNLFRSRRQIRGPLDFLYFKTFCAPSQASLVRFHHFCLPEFRETV